MSSKMTDSQIQETIQAYRALEEMAANLAEFAAASDVVYTETLGQTLALINALQSSRQRVQLKAKNQKRSAWHVSNTEREQAATEPAKEEEVKEFDTADTAGF
jgi:hypothetical protein